MPVLHLRAVIQPDVLYFHTIKCLLLVDAKIKSRSNSIRNKKDETEINHLIPTFWNKCGHFQNIYSGNIR